MTACHPPRQLAAQSYVYDIDSEFLLVVSSASPRSAPQGDSVPLAYRKAAGRAIPNLEQSRGTSW